MPPMLSPCDPLQRCWRHPMLLAIAVAAAVAAMAAPAAAYDVNYGKQDCLSPRMTVVDAWPLNTPNFQITAVSSDLAKSTPIATSGVTSDVTQQASGYGYDKDASPLNIVSPYWMENKGKSSVPASFAAVQSTAANFDPNRVTAFAQASQLSTGDVQTKMYVAPSTITVGNLFGITYYGTWKLVENFVTGTVSAAV